MEQSKINIVLWVASAVLLLTAVAFAIAYFVTAGNETKYKNQLEFVYEKSFYELVDNINNMEVNLSKLNSSNSRAYQADLVDKLVQESNQAQDNLASLPIDEQAISKTISFINSANGYCTSLAIQLAKGQGLSDDQKYSIEELYDSAQNVKQEVNRFATLLTNDYNIVENAKYNSGMMQSNFSKQFSTLEEPSVEYPQLIYDGPFSDSVLNKEIKGLSDKEVTKVEAQEIVKKDIFKYESISYDGMTDGKFVTYNFTLSFADNSVGFVQVTKNGGFILSYNRTHNIEHFHKSQEECVQIAENFARELGLKDMKSVWYADAEGYLYVNLAYCANEVVVYPDLVKIKVAMDKGLVVGLEGMTYAYNHVERKIPTPAIKENKAAESVALELDVQKMTLCIIPNEYVGETLAYELQATRNGMQFYVYVDANTGELIRVMRVVETDDGNLLM